MAIDAFIDSNLLDSNLTSIADTIRNKRNLPSSTKLLFPNDFITEINRISGGSSSVLIPKNINTNGTYDPNNDGADGYNMVTVNVNPILDSKVLISNGTYNASDDNLDGFSSITANIRPGLISPYIEDNTSIYANSTRIYNGSSGEYRSDIYQVEANKTYFVAIGNVIGNKFVATFTTHEPTTISGNTKGTNIINLSFPSAYTGSYFSSTDDGYIVITKDSNSTSGLKSYLYSIEGMINN